MWLVAFATEHFNFEENINLKSKRNRLPSMCSKLGNQQQVVQLLIIISGIH